MARKIFAKADKNFYLRGKISYIRGKNHWFLDKNEEKTLCLWALSSSLYKYTTFFREIQIALTFRNSPRNVKMQRFAAARVGHVLYYEDLVLVGYSRDSTRASSLLVSRKTFESSVSIYPYGSTLITNLYNFYSILIVEIIFLIPYTQ